MSFLTSGYWDRRAIRRIIENLCNNAIKYGKAESPVRLAVFRNGDHAVFTVQNSGDPISHEDLTTFTVSLPMDCRAPDSGTNSPN